ncbi:hypothetical protein [Shouchella patagoniensis]|uniref:hypothetical protein n=1 Tax=Shouchella patagoniensis TaxID=228576 RepID=UPI0014752729|nr:hypothetical protein [Shouchella patagoniensis]
MKRWIEVIIVTLMVFGGGIVLRFIFPGAVSWSAIILTTFIVFLIWTIFASPKKRV